MDLGLTKAYIARESTDFPVASAQVMEDHYCQSEDVTVTGKEMFCGRYVQKGGKKKRRRKGKAGERGSCPWSEGDPFVTAQDWNKGGTFWLQVVFFIFFWLQVVFFIL